MPNTFKDLSKPEQEAVNAHVQNEYDVLVFQQPTSYVSRNAQNNPEGWRDRLREMIACDSKRVEAITKTHELNKRNLRAFTLIEISIVVVIIGLIAGGVLVGQELVRAAGVRATITQIEKFNAATNTFRGKYGALPGDISATLVTQFGFTVVTTRAGTAAQGDGNGVIEGYNFASSNVKDGITNGETAWFWEDLSSNAHLIEGGFSWALGTGMPVGSNPPMALVLPAAKLGNGNFIYVYALNGVNYFGLSLVALIDNNGAIYDSGAGGATTGNSPGLTVAQAYAIDNKVDDGIPQSGNVTALYENWPLTSLSINYGPVWASGGGVAGALPGTAATGSSTTCYDNAGNSANPMQYSVGQSNGSNVNCALSFKFQ